MRFYAVPARIGKRKRCLNRLEVAYASFRNGFYSESALLQMGGIRETEMIAVPQDGPVSWTGRADLAEAAATALTKPGLFDGISPPLTSLPALDFRRWRQTRHQHSWPDRRKGNDQR